MSAGSWWRALLGWALRLRGRPRRVAPRAPERARPVTNRELLRWVSLILLGARPCAPHREALFHYGRITGRGASTYNHAFRRAGRRAFFAHHYVGRDGVGNLLAAPVKHGRGALRRQAARASHIRERL